LKNLKLQNAFVAKSCLGTLKKKIVSPP